jgi:hypothetical protein
MKNNLYKKIFLNRNQVKCKKKMRTENKKEDIPAIKEKENLLTDKDKILFEIDCLLSS